MNIRHSSFRRFPITPKYHPIFFKNIETYNPFAPVCFQFIWMHSMKRVGELFLTTGYIFFNKDLVYHYFWDKNLLFTTHKFSLFKFNDWQLYFKSFFYVISFWFGYNKWWSIPSMKYFHKSTKCLWLSKPINSFECIQWKELVNCF